MILMGLQVPEVLLGAGRIPEGLAQVQLEAFDRRVRSIQTELEKIIERQVFNRVLNANGLQEHVEFEWGEPSTAEENVSIQQLTVLLQNPMLSPGLRLELEKQLAGLFGVDESLIEPVEVQRDRELDREQPEVPGRNEKVIGHLFVK